MNWMHSCKRVAELLTQSLDEPLGWLDRIRMRVHLSMCDNCRNVEQQLLGVRALSADLFTTDDGETDGPGSPGVSAAVDAPMNRSS